MPSEDEDKAPRRRGPAGLWHGHTDGAGGEDRRPPAARKEPTGRGEDPSTPPQETASPVRPEAADEGADSEETVHVDRASVPGLSAPEPEPEGSRTAQEDTHGAPGAPAPDGGSTRPQAPGTPGPDAPAPGWARGSGGHVPPTAPNPGGQRPPENPGMHHRGPQGQGPGQGHTGPPPHRPPNPGARPPHPGHPGQQRPSMGPSGAPQGPPSGPQSPYGPPSGPQSPYGPPSGPQQPPQGTPPGPHYPQGGSHAQGQGASPSGPQSPYGAVGSAAASAGHPAGSASPPGWSARAGAGRTDVRAESSGARHVCPGRGRRGLSLRDPTCRRTALRATDRTTPGVSRGTRAPLVDAGAPAACRTTGPSRAPRHHPMRHRYRRRTRSLPT